MSSQMSIARKSVRGLMVFPWWKMALAGAMVSGLPDWAAPAQAQVSLVQVAPPGYLEPGSQGSALIAQPVPAAPSGPFEQPTVRAAKPEEKRVAFNMEGQRWSQVFQWLVDQTGLKYASSNNPQGSFTFKSPEGKKYTLGEIIDIINEGLDSNPDQQRYLLIRRDTSFVLVLADEKIDPVLVPRVSVDEVAGRGNTEVVTVVYSLNTLVAEEIAPEVKKLQGKYGEVVPLSRANQLVLQDSAGNLKRILKILKDIEENEGKGQGENLTHECKFIKAREAERILLSLLGGAGPVPAAQPQFDPRRGGDPRFQPPAQAPARGRQTSVIADERTNSVLVSGMPDKIAQAKEILKRIDIAQPGQLPVLVGPALLRQYDVNPGAAEAIAKTLQDIYKASTTVRISAVGTSAVMVYAGPDDQIEIGRQILGTAAGEKNTKAELIPLGSLDATKVADTLKAMLGDTKSGAPFVEADTERNAIVVRGTPNQILDVQATVKAMGASGGIGGNIRVINLEKGSASTLAEALERLIPKMRANPVQLINPLQQTSPAPKPLAPAPLPPVQGQPSPAGRPDVEPSHLGLGQLNPP